PTSSPRPTPHPLVGLVITTNCSRCFLHSLKYLTLSTSVPCAGTTSSSSPPLRCS
ncbi:hypothetical protein K443DRAFT_106028, partial [Laccaria amethystina LaAM-08-1]